VALLQVGVAHAGRIWLDQDGAHAYSDVEPSGVLRVATAGPFPFRLLYFHAAGSQPGLQLLTRLRPAASLVRVLTHGMQSLLYLQQHWHTQCRQVASGFSAFQHAAGATCKRGCR